MSVVPRAVLCLSVMTVLLSSAAPAWAQANRNRNQPMPNLPPANLVNGTVTSIRGGVLVVQASGQSYFVQPQPTKVVLVGEGDRGILKNGMDVRFTVKMGERMTPEEEITELEIFTPDDVNIYGTQDEGEGKMYVAGKLVSYARTGKATIKTPMHTIRAEVAEDAKVKLAVRDPSALALVQEGATVTIIGKLVRAADNGQPGAVIGQEFDIKLNEPISSSKKKKD